MKINMLIVLASVLVIMFIVCCMVCLIHEAYVAIKTFKDKKQSETVKAFKIVNKYIKKHYPFAKGKPWDKKHGNIHFMLGSYTLEEYIEEVIEYED